MIINQANISMLYKSLRVIFQEAFSAVAPTWNRIGMEVPSSTLIEDYAWLGAFPRMREWLGDRIVKDLSAYGYTIKNRDWETTVGIDRNNVEDDTYGIFRPIIQEMGRSAAAHPDELVWGMLLRGFTELCYDKKAFFATDHPMGDATASNNGGGSGTPWYLFDTSRAIKPIIFQNRRAPEFVAITRPDDESVFMTKKFMYGSDRRDNAGFGLWQLAYGSKQTLSAANYASARSAMMGYKDDQGKPLGVVPTLMAVGPSGESAARQVLRAERNADGSSNIWFNTAELLVVPWLA